MLAASNTRLRMAYAWMPKTMHHHVMAAIFAALPVIVWQRCHACFLTFVCCAYCHSCFLLFHMFVKEDGYSRPVAEVNKVKPNIQRDQPIPSHLDTYVLHTLPGIDSVFMLAVTIALDEAVFSPQQMAYGPYSRYGYGGYGGYGYGGYGYGGFGYGAPLLLGAGLLATPFLFGGFW